MGVTIVGAKKSLDLTFSGFSKLRQVVADLSNPKIGKHYSLIFEGFMLSTAARTEYFERYDAKTEELSEKFNGEMDNILDFLYAPDCEGEISVDTCKEIYELVKDHECETLFGYAGRIDNVRFDDFKSLLAECIDANEPVEWY